MLVRTLADGLTLWLDPMRDVRSAAAGIYVSAGSADEAPAAQGATHFLEHLLFRRTRRRSGAAIARLTDRLGGDCDAYTTKECVAFHARTTSDRLEEALALLVELTELPAFTPADVELERGIILEEMAELEDVPEDRLHEAFVRQTWPGHPLGEPILGHEAGLRSLGHRQLTARFRQIFRPRRMVLVVSGAFEPEGLTRAISRIRGRRRRLPELLSPVPPPVPEPPRPARCRFHLLRPDLNQTHLLAGATALPYADPAVPAAWLATIILGGGVSSRLWRAVRERHGLAYHVGASMTLHRQTGLAYIEAATAPRNLPRLVRAIGRIVQAARENGVTRAELSRAKDQVRAEIALSLESTSARREAAARSWLYRGRPVEADETLAEVAAVTLSDVESALGRILGGKEGLGIGVTGPDLAGLQLDELADELAA